tara:strand:+ start:562 stop:1254 length:693 start_codon:yes stop_codon:yes gene_type:complete
MAKKQYFFIVDTETTEKDNVADFAGVIVDRKGKIYNQIAVLVDGHYGKDKLFHDRNSSEEIWTLKGLEKRNNIYKDMLNNGQRMISSVAGINKWISQAKLNYPDLIFTAYNSKFDLGKMRNTGIDAEFKNQFCMWYSAVNEVQGNKAYIQHCIDRKWFTEKLNARTNAEAMAEFVAGGELPPEPHTALEDIIEYELLIFKWLMSKGSWRKLDQTGYNWRKWQISLTCQPK